MSEHGQCDKHEQARMNRLTKNIGNCQFYKLKSGKYFWHNIIYHIILKLTRATTKNLKFKFESEEYLQHTIKTSTRIGKKLRQRKSGRRN